MTSPSVTASTAVVGSSTGTGELPNQPSPAHVRMEKRWKRCRALMDDSDGIREGGEDYLPRFEQEPDGDYETRKNLVALTNAFSRTVFACTGLLLQERPELGDNMPEEIKKLAENIDASGMHFAVFTRQLAIDALIDGYSGILVDYQRVDSPQKISAADEQALGLRPYWVMFRAEDVFLQLYQVVNGQQTLVLLVLREVAEEVLGRFGVQNVTRYRVYTRVDDVVSFELWQTSVGDAGGAPARTIKPTPMRNVTAIPWSPCVAGRAISKSETRPPLLNLADLNIEHHQVKTDMRNLERLGMVPTLVRKGYVAPIGEDGKPNPAPVLLGPRQVIDVPIDGDVKWLTPDVTVLDPSARSLEDIKADMGAAGLAFLAPQTRAAETAEARRLDAAAQNATLATFAGNLQDCLELAFQFTAQYMKLTAGSVTVNTDFENTVMDSATITALNAVAAAGNLSIETLLLLLENGKVLPEGFDINEEISRILKQNILPPAPPPNPADNSAAA